MDLLFSLVSIPFIAGQWSLRVNFISVLLKALRVSIPFIAGQWSLRLGIMAITLCNNVSIPFIAGQWSLQGALLRTIGGLVVSIPFIAGQWSLHKVPRHAGNLPIVGFNPLHCGAVVASCFGSSSVYVRQLCFNPLHCGAVVASSET